MLDNSHQVAPTQATIFWRAGFFDTANNLDTFGFSCVTTSSCSPCLTTKGSAAAAEHGRLATQYSKTEFDAIDLPPETTPTGYSAAFITTNANNDALTEGRQDRSQQVKKNVPQHHSVSCPNREAARV